VRCLKAIVPVMAAVVLALAGPAHAQNLLTNPGFEDFTGPFDTSTDVAANTPATWDHWITQYTSTQALLGSSTSFPPGWSDNNFAAQDAPTSDLTDQIMQGIDGTSVVANKLVNVELKYINTGNGARAGLVQVFGLPAGTSWSRFAPWSCVGCTLLFSMALNTTATWTTISGSFTPTTTYAAVAIGIQLGGPTSIANSGFRAVDDVSLSQNQPPDCSSATASPSSLWPPNHQFVNISVVGVTDPDGDPFSITIDSIFQDEPVLSPGSGNTSPDGTGVGTSTARVRAEREGSGNGRVYHIGFTADDGNGGTCTGEVLVGVPKSQGANGGPVDGGALYDSTAP
jgi:hypothetical protein